MPEAILFLREESSLFQLWKNVEGEKKGRLMDKCYLIIDKPNCFRAFGPVIQTGLPRRGDKWRAKLNNVAYNELFIMISSLAWRFLLMV